MAKKSAKSKGYRKTVKKKPFLTKKEIIELVAIVAVIVVGIVLFNLFYDDGFLRKGDIQPGDVVSYVNRETNNRFAKVATVNDLPGFTRNDPDMSENPRVIYDFTPDEETDHISYMTVSGSYIPAEQLVQSIMSQSTGATFTEMQSAEVQGHDAYVFSYTADYYSEDAAKAAEEAEAPAEGEEAAEAEEPAEAEEAPAVGEETAEEQPSNVFNQTLSCYVEVGDFTVCFSIYRTGDDDSFYLPEDQVQDYVLGYTDAFTVYDRDAK